MKLKQWLEKWGMERLKLNLIFLESEWAPNDPDRNAAWELYVELLTRTATQPLAATQGSEISALESIHSLFHLTRDTLKKHGKYTTQFAKIAIPMLNQEIRPFTTKWHCIDISNKINDTTLREHFRGDLTELQTVLRRYTVALADIAGIEDLSALETIG